MHIMTYISAKLSYRCIHILTCMHGIHVQTCKGISLQLNEMLNLGLT